MVMSLFLIFLLVDSSKFYFFLVEHYLSILSGHYEFYQRKFLILAIYDILKAKQIFTHRTATEFVLIEQGENPFSIFWTIVAILRAMDAIICATVVSKLWQMDAMICATAVKRFQEWTLSIALCLLQCFVQWIQSLVPLQSQGFV